MGAQSSTPVQMEPTTDNDSSSPKKMTAEEIELLQLEQETMPKYMQVETFEQKLWRKFSQEPLVPIGCLTTAFFLGSGIKSFYNRDAARSQTMMRARVAAQFGTLLCLMGYAGLNSINFDIAPGYHEKDKKE